MKEITKEDIGWIYHLAEIGLPIVKEADKLKFMLEEIEEIKRRVAERYEAVEEMIKGSWIPLEIEDAKRRHKLSSDIEESMK
jgi:hypothetical protein